MEIDVLYVPDCPNRTTARDVVELALTQTQLTAVVREREIRTEEEAGRLGMRGSPTILIDGKDPFADGAGPAAMSCRLYPRAAWRLAVGAVEVPEAGSNCPTMGTSSPSTASLAAPPGTGSNTTARSCTPGAPSTPSASRRHWPSTPAP
jgi:hypothetical protein